MKTATARHLTGPLVVATCLALLAVAVPASTQSTTGGSIRGTVSDPSGGLLPGVSVIVTSDALVAGRQVATTSARGVYRFPALPPGEYVIQAELDGFRPVRQEGVRLGLGASLEVDLALGDPEFEEEIVVVGDAARVSTVANTISTNLDSDFLERQPLPRDTTQLMNRAPGISSNAAYGAPNAQATAYNLDGVDVSDPADGGQWILPNMSWVEEVQITGLGADAEYGGFTGAVVNLITRSGGNDFEGDVSLYYSDSGLNSSNAPSGFQTTSEIDADWEVSFGLGGKLVQDRLWYFVSGEERERTLDPFFADDAFDAPAAELDSYSREYHRYLGKLTYQHDMSNRIVALVDYDGLDTAKRNIGADGVVLASAAYDQDSPNWSYNLSWDTLVNDNNFASVKLTGFDGRNDRLPPAGPDVPGRRDYFGTELEWQNYQYAWDVSKERLNLDASWSLFADGLFGTTDSHAFKLGVVWEDSGQDEVRRRTGGFTYDDDSTYCDSTAEYFADPSCAVFSSTRGGEIDFHATQKGLHLYAQDSMKLDRVTLNYGLRYTQYQGGFKGGDDTVYDVDMVAPRLGVVWDVMGDGGTALKLHYGRYYEALMAFMYDREISGDAFSDREFWDWDPDTGGFDAFYGSSVVARAVMDPDISHPFVDQVVASVEHQLNDTMLIGVDYVHRESEDIIAMVNTNPDYDVLELTNPLTGEPLTVYELFSGQQNLLTNPAQAFRDYDSVILRYDKRHADGWSLRASLVWTDLESNTTDVDGYMEPFEDLNGLVNAAGKPAGYSEWELKTSASFDLPWDMVLSGYFTYRSGEYWTPYVQFRGGSDSFNNNTLVNLVPLGSEQLDDRSLFDLHLDKRFELGDSVGLVLLVDVFNVFNEDTVLEVNERYGRLWYDDYFSANDDFGSPTRIETPREIRVGARISF